jgi:hypothetical protein
MGEAEIGSRLVRFAHRPLGTHTVAAPLLACANRRNRASLRRYHPNRSGIGRFDARTAKRAGSLGRRVGRGVKRCPAFNPMRSARQGPGGQQLFERNSSDMLQHSAAPEKAGGPS